MTNNNTKNSVALLRVNSSQTKQAQVKHTTKLSVSELSEEELSQVCGGGAGSVSWD